jgi:hypothetical protein
MLIGFFRSKKSLLQSHVCLLAKLPKGRQGATLVDLPSTTDGREPAKFFSACKWFCQGPMIVWGAKKHAHQLLNGQGTQKSRT